MYSPPGASGSCKPRRDRRYICRRVRARSIQPGDIVLVNRRGRMFHAKVRGEAPDGAIVVEPIERGISYRHVRAREVVDHWRHGRERDTEQRQPPSQWSFDDLLDGRT
jgi:hypothetical protein